MPDEPPVVLIVGAGPTGLLLALLLARAGIHVRIIDSAPEPSTTSNAIGVQARTLELLERHGLAEALVARGRPVTEARIFSDRRPLARLRFDDIDTPYPFVLTVPQDETERVLRTALEGVGIAVDRPVVLTDLAQDKRGVTVALRRGDAAPETLRAEWVVGCDGAHSGVRHALGLAFDGFAFDLDFLLADVDLRWERPHNDIELYSSAQGIAALFALPGDRVRIVVGRHPTALPRASETEPSAPPTGAECQAIIEAQVPHPPHIAAVHWLSRFRSNSRLVRTMRSGRVFLAGDAAHIHSPAGAQGMNTGLQDAANLAWKLALVIGGSTDARLLDSYHAERHPIAVSVLRGTTTLTRVATARQPVVRHLVRWIAPRMARIPAIQRRIARTIAQLDIRYRGSPIVENHSVASPVHAGDRAPDAPVTVAATGAPTRLFQLFGGMLHSVVFVERADAPDAVRLVATTLADVVVGRYAPWVAVYLVGGLDSAPLSPAPAPAPVEPIVLVDHAGQVRARYGASVQVIRPDGYTGFRGRIDDGAQLLSYLDRLLPAAMPA